MSEIETQKTWEQLTPEQTDLWKNVAIGVFGTAGCFTPFVREYFNKMQRITAELNSMSPEELEAWLEAQDKLRYTKTLVIEAGQFPLCAVKDCQNKAQMRVKDPKKNLVFSICDLHAEQSDYELVERINPV